MEFMILFILFLVAITVALAVAVHRTNAVSQAQLDLSAKMVLDSARDKINTAFLEGDGFSTRVTMPERILRLGYTLDVNSNEVILRMGGKTYISYLLTTNVTGSFSKGVNLVTNRDGEIIIMEES